MKKYIILLLILILCVAVFAIREDNGIYLLAEQISAKMGNEPFVVRVAYGEVLLKGKTESRGRKTPSQSDIRAAAAAYCNYGFSGDAENVIKWEKAKNTPLEMRSGVRLYNWFFYR